MDLHPFYFDVKIEGVALVYAESPEDALYRLEDAGVMVAGNKMRHQRPIKILSEPRDAP